MKKKKNILDEREQVISKAEAKLFEIYSQIIDSDLLSVYQSELLSNKMLILATELDEYMAAHNEFIKKLKIKCKNVAYISLLISLINLTLFFLNPFISVIISFLLLKIVQNYKNKWDAASKSDFITKLETIKTITDNCSTFLEVKNKKREEKIASLDPVYQLDFSRACDFLEYYLNEIDVTNVLSGLEGYDSVKKILLKMLQDDLQMSSDNLEELLNIARSKVSMEKLESELKLSRILPEKYGK